MGSIAPPPAGKGSSEKRSATAATNSTHSLAAMVPNHPYDYIIKSLGDGGVKDGLISAPLTVSLWQKSGLAPSLLSQVSEREKLEELLTFTLNLLSL